MPLPNAPTSLPGPGFEKVAEALPKTPLQPNTLSQAVGNKVAATTSAVSGPLSILPGAAVLSVLGYVAKKCFINPLTSLFNGSKNTV